MDEYTKRPAKILANEMPDAKGNHDRKDVIEHPSPVSHANFDLKAEPHLSLLNRFDSARGRWGGRQSPYNYFNKIIFCVWICGPDCSR